MMASRATHPQPPFGHPLPGGARGIIGRSRRDDELYHEIAGWPQNCLPPCGGGLRWGGSSLGHRARPIHWKFPKDSPPTFILPHKGGGDQIP